jgi:hypothetical protein
MGQCAAPVYQANGYGASYAQCHSSPISPGRADQQGRNGRKQCNVKGKQSHALSEATTICFQNIPNSYNRRMIFELLDANGFKGLYDFMYVPYDFKRLPALANLGYFFVNFTSHKYALQAWLKFVGFNEWLTDSDKVMAATWASRMQGKAACIEKFQNSPVMHEKVPLECKPVLIENGMIVHLTPIKSITKQPRFLNGVGVKLVAKLYGDSQESCPDTVGQVCSNGYGLESGTAAVHQLDLLTTAACAITDSDSDSPARSEDAAFTSSTSRDNGCIPDEAPDVCLCCDKAFTMLRRRHRCQACGCLYCAECAPRTGRFRTCKGCVEGSSLASSSVPMELSKQPRVKGNSGPLTLLQSFALRRTGHLLEVKNTFIDLKLPPSECKMIHTESLPL